MATGKELETAARAVSGSELTVTSELARDDSGAQFLTFTLDGEEYGVEILRVQEIKGWMPVTRVPNTPDYMQGVLNLRGTIVPIIDLRMRFNLTQVEYTPVTVVIVLTIIDGERRRTLGVVVDGVSDVVTVDRSELRPPPDFGTNVQTDFIDGIATVDEKMVMLLDIDRLLSSEELQDINASTEQAGSEPKLAQGEE